MNIFDIWISTLKISAENKLKLLKMYGTTENIYKSTVENRNTKQLIGIKKINYDEIEKIEKIMEHKNINLVNYNDKDYPRALLPFDDAPVVLYYLGNIQKLNDINKSAAVIGARNCSYYGKNVVELFAAELTKYNINVISGMARGIDGYAHNACLKNNGFTCGVLGCGVDVVYPKENINIYNEMIKCGCIISEFPPGTIPYPYNFPIRNRIISGLSDIIIVIEAGQKSGSLKTVDFALAQGKDVVAVPGQILSERSKGTNKLIKDGANMITEFRDILDILDIEYLEKKVVKNRALSPLENKICTLITDEPIHIDDIYKKSNVDINELYGLLFELQFKNEIMCLSGNYYVRSNYNI